MINTLSTLYIAQDPRNPNQRWLDVSYIDQSGNFVRQQYTLSQDQLAQFQNAGLPVQYEWNNPLAYNQGPLTPDAVNNISSAQNYDNSTLGQYGVNSGTVQNALKTYSTSATTSGQDLAVNATKDQQLLDYAVGGKYNVLTPGATQGPGGATYGPVDNAPTTADPKAPTQTSTPPTPSAGSSQAPAGSVSAASTGTGGGGVQTNATVNFYRYQDNGTIFDSQNRAYANEAAAKAAGWIPGAEQVIPQNAPANAFANYQVINSANDLAGTTGGAPGTSTAPAATGGTAPADTGLPDKYKTGNPAIDAVLGQMYSLINKNIAAGNAVNPNLTIDSNTIQQFIDQAHKEIDPYYATQLGAIKDDLVSNLKTTADTYAKTAAQEALSFKQNIRGTQESAAGAGLAFSGSRALGEQEATQAEQATLDLDQLRAASSAAAAARQAESQIGTANMAGISTPALPSYLALISPSGADITPGSPDSYYTPGSGSAGNVLGTLPAQQATDVASRVSALKSDYLTQRTYGSLTTPTA